MWRKEKRAIFFFVQIMERYTYHLVNMSKHVHSRCTCSKLLCRNHATLCIKYKLPPSLLHCMYWMRKKAESESKRERKKLNVKKYKKDLEFYLHSDGDWISEKFHQSECVKPFLMIEHLLIPIPWRYIFEMNVQLFFSFFLFGCV